MIILDPEATFAKLDKLRERMDRLEQAPDAAQWQDTRLLIRALAESIARSKKSSVAVTRKVRGDAPAPVLSDWQELVGVLLTKGIRSENSPSALRPR